MAGNSFGKIFKITTFGESHGIALGCVVDGCPAGLRISESEIQQELDKRKPGIGKLSSPRTEPDNVKILSGIFQGKTIGAPIAMIVYNQDVDSSAYSPNLFRPAHADKTYQDKYGLRDWRGGGRASGRETVARVMAGAIAKKILYQKNKTQIISKISKLGGAKKNGEINIIIKKPPKNLGEPVFDKLKANLAKALLSIGAVYSFEFNPESILGGISTGRDIIIKIKIKPTPSLGLKGRYDVCLAPRIMPVTESMVALVLVDYYLLNKLAKF